ncbi:hypothetical protein SY88_08535 [Clostridiales bacterium PH28_bin88]|nr:hypothetical protein SY88_08535 [Clostridiales bacterium PH28_bin88]
MTRILVVDDEPLERQAIEFIICRSNLGVEVAGEARNGAEAIRRAKELQPDIIFMDIKMPGINGLMAAREIKELVPDVEIIMLTAYDEFSYAQEALRLGAAEYLLKPVHPEEVIALLERLVDKVYLKRYQLEGEARLKEQLRQAAPELRTGLITGLIFGTFTNSDTLKVKAQMLGIPVLPSVVLVAEIDGLGEMVEAEREAVRYQVRHRIQKLLENYSAELIVPLSDAMIVAVWNHKECDAADAKEQAGALGEEIRRCVEKETPVTVSVGVGRCYGDPLMLRTSYLEASSAQKLGNFYLGGNRVIHIDDLKALQSGPQVYPFDKEQEMIQRARSGDMEGARSVFHELFNQLLEIPGYPLSLVKARLMEVLVLLGRAWMEAGASPEEVSEVNLSFLKTIPRCDTPTALSRWAEQVVQTFVERVKPTTARVSSSVVAQAVQYIWHNFHRDITLEEMSKVIFLSPDYFSRVFKQEMGCTFIEYLTKARIDRAKELLRKQELSVSEVGRRIGYEDPNYFSRVFSKVEGISPREFRRRMTGDVK